MENNTSICDNSIRKILNWLYTLKLRVRTCCNWDELNTWIIFYFINQFYNFLKKDPNDTII